MGKGLVSCFLTHSVYFKKNTRKQFYQTALGHCCGLKLPKFWLQFKENKFTVSFVIIFGTLSFPISLHVWVCVWVCVCVRACVCVSFRYRSARAEIERRLGVRRIFVDVRKREHENSASAQPDQQLGYDEHRQDPRMSEWRHGVDVVMATTSSSSSSSSGHVVSGTQLHGLGRWGTCVACNHTIISNQSNKFLQ